MRPEVFVRLLEDGAEIESPSADLRAAAEELQSLGLVELQLAEFVRCAEPRDADFVRSTRSCAARVILPAGYDADGGELRCPGCDRAVFPDADRKRRHEQLRVRVRYDGVVDYLRSLLSGCFGEVALAAEGVLRVALGAWASTCAWSTSAARASF